MKRSARIRWVGNKRTCFRWFSQQAFIAQAALVVTWQTLGDDLKAAIPHWLVVAIAIAICAFGFLGRLIDQSPREDKDHAE